MSGPDQGQELDVGDGVFTVGQAADCALVLTDPTVSRRHLSVQATDEGIVLRDLASKNGSFVGDARFNELVAGAGVVVRIGATELKLAGPEAAAHLPPSQATRFGELIGKSLKMREVFGILERVSSTGVPVLIGGETGTGKELCAEAIHHASRVAAGPFVVCDLAGLPRGLIESELFGHVRGAFTGADREREGAFVKANGGTIFIDEVGELELDIQPRLLRVLERRQIKPVGSGTYRPVDMRVVAATNRDLRAECEAGRFRADLFHRLSVVHVVLPSLRERKEDIPLLVESWLGAGGIEVPDETMSILVEYDWPGNVRELRNVLDRGLSLLAGATVLRPEYLGLQVETHLVLPSGGDYKRAKEKLIRAWEQRFVKRLIERAGGNIAAAARDGGLDRVYLYRLMRKHGIKIAGSQGDA